MSSRLLLLLTIPWMPLAAVGAPPAEANVSDDRLAGFVDGRIQEWQPTASERRFDEIGWATEICEAERLSRRSGRPVFLFTHDGRIAIGRC